VSNSSCNFSGEQIDRALWVRVEIQLVFCFLGLKEFQRMNVLACESGFSVDRVDEFWLGGFYHNIKIQRDWLHSFSKVNCRERWSEFSCSRKRSLIHIHCQTQRRCCPCSVKWTMSVSQKASKKWTRYFQQFSNFVLPKIFSTASFQLRENKLKTLCSFLTSWHNSIFGYKLRTVEAENP